MSAFPFNQTNWEGEEWNKEKQQQSFHMITMHTNITSGIYPVNLYTFILGENKNNPLQNVRRLQWVEWVASLNGHHFQFT